MLVARQKGYVIEVLRMHIDLEYGDHGSDEFWLGFNRMTVSVIITTYNDESEIETLLNSIFSQTMQPDEIIITDGGSVDATVSIIKDFRKEKRRIPMRLFYGRRLNIAQGLNNGIIEARSDAVAIMMTGNKYENDFIEELSVMCEESDIAIAPLCGCTDSRFQEVYCISNGILFPGNRLASNHGIMLRRKVFSMVGLFYEYFKYAGEDAEFFYRARKEKAIVFSCAWNARVYWQVPANLSQLNRQIENYTIASMQWEPLRFIAKRISRLLLSILVICGMIVATMFLQDLIFHKMVILYTVILFAVVVLRYYKRFLRFGFIQSMQSIVLSVYVEIKRICFAIRNLKYAFGESRIKASRIRFL